MCVREAVGKNEREREERSYQTNPGCHAIEMKGLPTLYLPCQNIEWPLLQTTSKNSVHSEPTLYIIIIISYAADTSAERVMDIHTYTRM